MPKIIPFEIRFWRHVDKSGDCWMWTAAKDHTGYGRFNIQQKTYAAHRLAWILTFGEIPTGLYACHKCDIRLCVNPAHLFLGTAKENTQDCIKKGRFVEPKRLTKLTPEIVRNIRARYSQGIRQIKLCQEFNLPDDQICRIVNRSRWTNV